MGDVLIWSFPRDSMSLEINNKKCIFKYLFVTFFQDNNGGLVPHKGSISYSMHSHTSLRNKSTIENVVNWGLVRKKYKYLIGEETTKPADNPSLTEIT